MGVGEWFGRAWYDVKDFFSISEVEASKDEYEMLIQSLKNAIKQIDEWGLKHDETVKEYHREWVKNGEGSSGIIVDMFADKRAGHYRKYDGIVAEFYVVKDEFNERLRQAEEMRDYLQGLCLQEEEEMRNMSKEEITYE